jgi:hypothetical protein
MIANIESVLEKDFNPIFLAIDPIEEDTINIVISSPCFINQTVSDRISSVYRCIENKCPKAFDKYKIFVSTFTDEEMSDVFDHLNKDLDE